MEIRLGNLKGHFRTAAAGGIILAAVALFFSCGDPFVPLESRWTTIAGFPSGIPGIHNIKVVTRTAEGLYILTYEGRGNPEQNLWAYNPTVGYLKKLSISYKPDERGLNTFGFNADGDEVWLGGYANTTPGGETWRYKPLIYRYKGTTREDITTPPGLLGAVGAIIPIGADECWLTIGVDPLSQSGYGGTVYKYSKGVFSSYPEIGVVPGLLTNHYGSTIVRDAISGWTYFIPKRSLEVVITTDDGATWYREQLPAPAGGHRLDYITNICANGPECYILAFGEIGSYAIYKRTGPPGAGNYELTFYHYPGPHMGQLRELAIDIHGRALAVGYNSCMIEENGVWREEDLPGDVYDGISFPCAAPGGGFYGFGASGLMYHP